MWVGKYKRFTTRSRVFGVVWLGRVGLLYKGQGFSAHSQGLGHNSNQVSSLGRSQVQSQWIFGPSQGFSAQSRGFRPRSKSTMHSLVKFSNLGLVLIKSRRSIELNPTSMEVNSEPQVHQQNTATSSGACSQRDVLLNTPSNCPFILLSYLLYITQITLLGAVSPSRFVTPSFLLVVIAPISPVHVVFVVLKQQDDSSRIWFRFHLDKGFFVCGSMSRARKGLLDVVRLHSFPMIPHTSYPNNVLV